MVLKLCGLVRVRMVLLVFFEVIVEMMVFIVDFLFDGFLSSSIMLCFEMVCIVL